MSDDADLTDEKMEVELKAQINNCRTGVVLPATGRCHYCKQRVGKGKRFCDADCRDDWEHQQKMAGIRGKPGQ